MKRLGKLDRREAIVGWMFILPTILILLTIRGIPMITAFVKSFTNWDGMYKNDFVGLRNYILILGKEEFWALLKNNLVLLLFIPIQVLIGVIVAVLLFEEVRGWKVFRSLYYIPQVISPLIIGFLFAVLFGYNGPINVLLRGIGLNTWAIDWLGSGTTALPVIIFCLVWINIGWQGMLVLVGNRRDSAFRL